MIKMGIIAIILAFAPMRIVYGIGMGDLLVESHLDQAFRAQLPLKDIGELNIDEIRVKLGSAEDFEQAALDFSDFLSNLTFSIIKNAKQEVRIQIKSDHPVVDPYIAFVLEVSWSTGRLLKEFSVLIDPIESKPGPLPGPVPGSVLEPEPVSEPVSLEKSKVLPTSMPLATKLAPTRSPIVVRVPKKPLELLSPTAQPENMTQRLVMIEEMLDTLTENNRMLQAKQNEYQVENQALLALLKVKEQEIMQLKMPLPPKKSSVLLLVSVWGMAIGLLISLVFLLRLKKPKYLLE